MHLGQHGLQGGLTSPAHHDDLAGEAWTFSIERLEAKACGAWAIASPMPATAASEAASASPSSR